MTEDRRGVALVFPGQGVSLGTLADSLPSRAGFLGRLAPVREYLGVTSDWAEISARALSDNATASLLTVLASVLDLDAWRERGETEIFYGGYSVGQWTALYAAGALSYEDLISAVHRRSKLMDEHHEGTGAMLAVIGLPEDKLVQWLSEPGFGRDRLTISNYNSLGQHSLSGEASAVAEAVASLARHPDVRKVVPLPVTGAWHSPHLARAQEPFGRFLESIRFRPFRRPVLDNVTGGFLPSEGRALRLQLVRHLAEPVRWSDGIRLLAKNGCTRFVEVGHGDMLTKFGAFIERRLSHERATAEVNA